MFQFIIQGYPFTALLLFFLYCFHGNKRPWYYSLARTANLLLWLNLLFLLLLSVFIQTWAFLQLDTIARFLRKNMGNMTLDFFLSPLGLIFIALLFKKVRNQAVWIL